MKSIFEHLKQFSKIVVTGPQRSGTSICARMISYDLGLKNVVEEDLKEVASIDRMRNLYDTDDDWVLQYPACFHKVVEFGNWPGMAVVCMQRSIEDIIASQERIGWTRQNEPEEMKHYPGHETPVSIVKYTLWDEWKHQIPHPFEIEYESLSVHPLWVSVEVRRSDKWFHPRQTALYR